MKEELRKTLLESEEEEKDALEAELADIEERFESAVSRMVLEGIEEDLEDLARAFTKINEVFIHSFISI